MLARYPPRQVHYGHVRVRINYPYRYPTPTPTPTPNQVHYGHEDVMHQQFERPARPHDTPALTSPLAPRLGLGLGCPPSRRPRPAAAES